MNRIALYILVFMISFLFFTNPSVFTFMVESEIDITNDCSKNHTVEGVKEVDVYLCDPGSYGLSGRSGYSVIDGYIIKVNKSTAHTGELLLHELGHSIGYRHSESGIMKPGRSEDNELGKREIEIARSFEAFRIINWSDEEDLRYIRQRGHNVSEYKGKGCRSIYFKDYKEWWSGDRFYNCETQ